MVARRLEDIELQTIQGFSCYEGLIYSIGMWQGRRMGLLFGDCWNFTYSTALEPLVGERVGWGYERLSEKCDHRKLLSVEVLAPDEKGVFEGLARQLPVLLDIDTYYCPWHADYHRRSNSHICLAIGPSGDGGVICHDALPFFRRVPLGKEDLRSGCKRATILTVCPVEEPTNIIDWVRESVVKVESSLDANASLCALDALQVFAADIAALHDLTGEFAPFSQVWEAPLWANLTMIECGRRQFSIFLDEVAQCTGDDRYTTTAVKFASLAVQWNVLVKGLYADYYAGGVLRSDSIALRLARISAEERGLAKELRVCLTEQRREKIVRATPGYSRAERHAIELRAYLNSRGISVDSNNSALADLTGTGIWIDGATLQMLLQTDVGLFTDLAIGQPEGDNVICTSQVIAVHAKQVTCFHFLGCSEWGDSAGELFVEGTDGQYRVFHLRFTNLSEAPRYGETVVYRGSLAANSTRHQSSSFQTIGNLLHQAVSFPNPMDVARIVLPNCPNMHLFAITVERLYESAR